MSDFDKEAEREKLREKFEQEEEQRAATEQMSELLLKGATMTNAHCTDCGDPIFRYDGQEFCPTCQKPVTRDQPEAGEEGEESADAGDHIEVADPSDDATVQFGASEDQANGADEQAGAAAAEGPESAGTTGDSRLGEPAAEAQSDAAEQPNAAQQPDPVEPAAQDGQPSPQRQSASDHPQGQAGGDRSPAQPTADTPDTAVDPTQSVPSVDPETDQRGARPSTLTDPSGGSVADQLSAAESNLATTVERFARRAAETDDPRAAREHLKAAREAAEALDAVRY